MSKTCPGCGALEDERFRCCSTCGYDWDTERPGCDRRTARRARRGVPGSPPRPWEWVAFIIGGVALGMILLILLVAGAYFRE